MVLNETHIREIVSESLRCVLSELNVGVIGRSGPITGSEMVVPGQKFAKEYELLLKFFEKRRKNPNFSATIEQVFGDTEAYRVYKNYYNAMMSKEGKKAISFSTWLKFVCKGKKGRPIMGFEVDGNYLFGLWIDGYFLCAYFAPNNPMGMFRVVGGISQYNNIIFAVTQDMSSMLSRLGIPKASETHNAPWRGKTVTKDIFGTSQKAIEKGEQILDMSMKMKNGSKDIEMPKDAETLKALISKFKEMSPEQQQKFKNKYASTLLKQNSGLLGKLIKNGIRI